jgi:DNA polymerase III epsilon subunit-like protein
MSGKCLYFEMLQNSKRPYKCCSNGGRGCKTSPTHDFQMPLRAIKHEDFRQTPPASVEPKFLAVALDCEMAGVAGGSSEAILLCVTDYFTGAVLLNRYVCPREPITQIRSSIHGISKSTLENAIQQGQTLWGWEGARSELWKYIDSNTIIVGHALEHDLDALRMIHPRIVDSGILSRKAVGIHRIRWGLQTLCSELVHVGIRENKGAIHDCLEDVLATREVVLFCTQKKEAFQTWAEAKKAEELRLEKERESRRQEKQSRNDAVTAGGRGSCRTYPDSDDEGEEVLHWSDIAEDLGWPHPDTGYDPWSD